MDAITVYEEFVRRAFGMAAGAQPIDRYEDPARLADADCCRNGYLTDAKAATAYAMAIYKRLALAELDVDDARLVAAAEAMDRLFAATSIRQVYDLIGEFDAIGLPR